MEKLKNTFQTTIYTYLHIKRERKQFTYMQQKKKKFRIRSLKEEESAEMQKPGKENAGECEE
jgi:hypothetical protein